MKAFLILLWLLVCHYGYAQFPVAEWQWSVPLPGVVSPETNAPPQAFLWIPPTCSHVKGVVLGQHNMVEEGIFEHPSFRKTLSELDLAVIWVTPAFSVTFDFTKQEERPFEEMMRSLASVSGYTELATAPIVPMGHSALASFPWNFAAWNPARTLAVVSIHGDSPQTTHTGSGRPNPDWGNRTMEGVPGLFIMGEYEWGEFRLTPGLKYVQSFPNTPITFFADAGHGHFDYSDELIDYIGLFLRKCVQYRLTTNALRPVFPTSGWLMDRWRKDSLPLAPAAPYRAFQGEKRSASWVFDEEMARMTERFYARARGKTRTYLGVRQRGIVLPYKNSHTGFALPFAPLPDGITFRIQAFFSDSSQVKPTENHPRTPIRIERITGPVVRLDDSTFQIRFYRMGFNNPKRSHDIWLLARHSGDDSYKSTVQQMNLKFPNRNTEGAVQTLTFPSIPNQKAGIRRLKIQARSSMNLPVSMYVKEGPAYVTDQGLTFTQLPPRTRYPVKVTVVAWQYGRSAEPKIQTATPIEQSFYLVQ